MKRLLPIIPLLLLLLTVSAYGQGPQPSLTVKEQDGTPTVNGVKTIKVTNGTLTNNGSGVVSIDTGGGGGTPGGSDTQLQYNNNGAFGGVGGATSDGTTLTLNNPIFTGHASQPTLAPRQLYYDTSDDGLYILNNAGSQVNQILTTNVGPIGVPLGGTGNATLAAYGMLFGGTTSAAAIQALAPGTNTQFLQMIGSGGLPTWATMSGDATIAAGGALTLATVNSNIGSFGSTTQTSQITVNGKGLITAATGVTITPAVGSITGLGTGVATALGINVGTAGAPVVLNGALGTPSSGTATNLTGTASGLTAGTVTTNANLAGVVISSSSNTTTPGKVDVMQTSLYCSDAGANDTYTCNLSPAATAYVTGTTYRFKANTANTGAASINFNGVGALTIVKPQGAITTTLADNDIRAGQWVTCTYDGTNCQMISQLGNAPSASGITIGTTAVASGTATRLLFEGAGNVVSEDSDLTFLTDTLTATKIVGSTSITDSGLTATRVTLAGTAGLLADDADMTFTTDTLTVTKAKTANLIVPSDAANALQIFKSNGTTPLVALDDAASDSTKFVVVNEFNISGSPQERGIITQENADFAHSAHFSARRSRGTNASPTTLQTDDYILGLVNLPRGSSAYTESGYIASKVNSSVSGNNFSTEWIIATSLSGTTNEVWNIDQNGNIAVGTGNTPAPVFNSVSAPREYIKTQAATSASEGFQIVNSSSTLLMSVRNDGNLCVFSHTDPAACDARITAKQDAGASTATVLNLSNDVDVNYHVDITGSSVVDKRVIVGSTTSTAFVVQTGGTERMRISGTGASNFTGTLANTGIASDATHTDSTVCQDTTTHLFYAGSGAAGICLGTSSARFKRDWEYLNTPVLDQVNALRVGTFNYLKGYGDDGARRQIGVLAEDVAKVMPEMVVRDAEGQPLQVDYMGVLLKLIPAMQEQQRQIDALKAEVTKLKEKLPIQ